MAEVLELFPVYPTLFSFFFEITISENTEELNPFCGALLYTPWSNQTICLLYLVCEESAWQLSVSALRGLFILNLDETMTLQATNTDKPHGPLAIY